MLDLTTVGSSGIINGAEFRQFDPNNATGTGLIDSFVRVQANGTEKGYNTDGAIDTDMDTKVGIWTHSLQLSQIPTVTFGSIVYREFLLDINESPGGGNEFISLDVLKIHIENTGDMVNYSTIPFSAPVYDMGSGNYIKLDTTLASGSGDGDMLAFIPSSLFGTDDTKYVYLYSEFGNNVPCEDGFEEWAVGADGPIVPEPATLSLLALGALAMLCRRRWKRA
jgi:hypothetical protein